MTRLLPSFNRRWTSARVLPTLAALIVIALGFVPLANILQGAPYIPWWSAAVHEWLVTGSVILLVAVLTALLLGKRLDRLGHRLAGLALAPSDRWFVAVAAGSALLLTTIFAFYCFARQPFSQDELAQRFHAHLLLAGRLFARAEAHPEFFSATGVLNAGGRLTSQYPIGGPALLALGMALHSAWLVNPFLTAFTVRNLHRFAADVYGKSVARASVALFVFSPFVLIMGASQMNHVGAVALGTLALAALPAWARSSEKARAPSRRAAMLIGLGVGGLATIRPLDAVVVGAGIGGFQLWLLRREPWRWRSLVLELLAGSLPVAGLLYANAQTTGRPLVFAYDVLYGPNERLGFHLDPFGRPHTPLHGLLLASANLMRLQRYLFEWPLPGLLPVAVALFMLRRPSRWDLLLLALIGGQVLAYALYWFDGFFAGPRFMFTIVPALVVFAARAPGLATMGMRAPMRRVVWLVIPFCLAWAWIVPTGTSSVQMRAYYYHVGRSKLKMDVAAQVRHARLDHALVFVHESWRARLDARLRALGLSPGESDRILWSRDACQVQEALVAEERRGPADSAGRMARLWSTTRPTAPLGRVAGLSADQSIQLAKGRQLTPLCVHEILTDSVGVAPFAPFLALEGLDPDGSLGGRIVFARDFGERNELLRTRFPDRTWYRYRSPRSPHDTTAPFLPYP